MFNLVSGCHNTVFAGIFVMVISAIAMHSQILELNCLIAIRNY